VKQILADYGDTVRIGQVLVVLDKEGWPRGSAGRASFRPLRPPTKLQPP
jgi:pyruvate/2-oxoglutarate dehydrogenase complex dihydrolipoamide acyltransferase (E2) component